MIVFSLSTIVFVIQLAILAHMVLSLREGRKARAAALQIARENGQREAVVTMSRLVPGWMQGNLEAIQRAEREAKHAVARGMNQVDAANEALARNRPPLLSDLASATIAELRGLQGEEGER